MRRLPSKLLMAVMIALGCIVTGMLGGLLAMRSEVFAERAIDGVASLAALGAALATFLTINEMRDSRMAAARARVTAKSTDQIIEYRLDTRGGSFGADEGDVRLTLRNASQGIAQNIHLLWNIDALSGAEIQNIASLIPKNCTVRTGDKGFAVCFELPGGEITVPVSSKEMEYIGDLGPSQELYASIPPVVLNLLAIRWLGLVGRVNSGARVTAEDVPRAVMRFVHDSPYQRENIDEHLLKFYLEDVAYLNARGQATNFAGQWVEIRLNLRCGFSSDAAERAFQVVTRAQ